MERIILKRKTLLAAKTFRKSHRVKTKKHLNFNYTF